MSTLAKFGVGLLLTVIVLVGLTEYVKARILGGATWSAAAKEKAQASAAAIDTVKQADAAALPALTRYADTRERVRRHPAPPKPLVDTLIADADSARSADSVRIAKRDTAIDKLRDQVKTLEHRPGPARLTAYAEGMWDVIGQKPVARLGADLRILKWFSVTGALDATLTDRPRAMIGARYTFR